MCWLAGTYFHSFDPMVGDAPNVVDVDIGEGFRCICAENVEYVVVKCWRLDELNQAERIKDGGKAIIDGNRTIPPDNTPTIPLDNTTEQYSPGKYPGTIPPSLYPLDITPIKIGQKYNNIIQFFYW